MPYTNAGTQRTYVMPVLAIIAAVLQVAIAPQISILGGRFNFMLAFAVAVALRGDATQAVYAGFFSGLFYDLTATVPIGLMALITTVCSFALASVGGAGTSGFSSTSIRLAGVGIFAACIVNAVALVLLGAEGNILFSLGHGAVTAILTSIASIPFLMASGSPSALSGGGFSARGGRSGSRFKTVPRTRRRTLH